MWNDTLKLIVSIIYAILFILYVVTLIIARVKNKKLKTENDEQSDFTLKLITLLGTIKDYIVKAEMFTNWTGAEKQAYVKKMLAVMFQELGIDEELQNTLIDTEVAFTKRVNYKGVENGTENTDTDTADTTDGNRCD